MKKVVSPCIYCGCGCKLTYHVENNKIVKISGVPTDDISDGKPCIKGLTINEVFNKNRIQSPYIKKNGKLVKATWDEAINKIYEKIKQTNPKDIFLNGSGKITNENNLLLYKIGTLLFNTNNIDTCCGRLCHISTVKGVMDCFGTPNLTRISNLNKIDTLFIIGSNPAISYPVFWNKILKRKNKLKIISVQPLENLTSKFGDNFLEIEPGSEVVLLNGIMSYLIENNKFEKDAIKFPNFKKLKAITKKYTPEYISKICKINQEEFLETCKQISNSKKLGIFHGMNFTQHLNSMGNVYSLMNLALLKNALFLTLRGEINVQGVGDVFSVNKEKLKGNIIKSFILKPNKVAFITEFNPAQSLPALNTVHKNLENMFIVYSGSYFNLTCNYADVILPLPTLFETTGTITNGEQRMRFVNQVIKTKNPSFLQIAKLLAKKFNKEDLFQYKDSKEISKEIIDTVPWYSKINLNEIYENKDAFPNRKIKYRKFFPQEYTGKETKRTKKYPLILTTFREQHQFLTSEQTEQSKTLTKLDKDKYHIYINKKDANKLKLKDEDKIKITSESGEIEALTRISEKVPEGLVATRFHYKKMLVNKLFPPKFDKITYTPNFKSCAVKIEKIN
jgi:formate dehydrogenase major subunit